MDNVAKNDVVKDVVPSMDGFMDLVGNGAKVSLGLGAAGFAGAFASRFKSPIPILSSRSLGSGLSMLGLYIGFRKTKGIARDVFGYAAAGSAVYTAGSLLYDGLRAVNVQLPGWANFAINTMSGVGPVTVEGKGAKEPGNDDVDVSTAFA